MLKVFSSMEKDIARAISCFTYNYENDAVRGYSLVKSFMITDIKFIPKFKNRLINFYTEFL